MTDYVLGGGCFWCLDAAFRRLHGVISVESGYAGGDMQSPGYYQVASGNTGHAEVVRVQFDESLIPAEVILDVFFSVHDPTTLNRQGADEGTQYRSVMLYQTPKQKDLFEHALDQAQSSWPHSIVTEIAPLDVFYPAETEHQDYYNKQPSAGYCQVIITPKLLKFSDKFARYLKKPLD